MTPTPESATPSSIDHRKLSPSWGRTLQLPPPPNPTNGSLTLPGPGAIAPRSTPSSKPPDPKSRRNRNRSRSQRASAAPASKRIGAPHFPPDARPQKPESTPTSCGWLKFAPYAQNIQLPAQRDLSPLTGLTSLQNLDLSWCKQLKGDLSPLAGLTSLRRLDLSYCEQLSATRPRWQASPRSNRSAGLPHSNPCCLR